MWNGERCAHGWSVCAYMVQGSDVIGRLDRAARESVQRLLGGTAGGVVSKGDHIINKADTMLASHAYTHAHSQTQHICIQTYMYAYKQKQSTTKQ